nr:retrovirus-related Pol polyprotein from transposon TNT 1-94 [Tanacetum cinerariifolium]
RGEALQAKKAKPLKRTESSNPKRSKTPTKRRGEALQAKKAKPLKRTESSNPKRSKTPTKSRCSRHMNGVKSYLYKYVEKPGPKVVFGDDSTCTTKGYGSIKCNGAKLFLEAETYLLPLAGAEDGSTPTNFSSGGRGVLQTEDLLDPRSGLI